MFGRTPTVRGTKSWRKLDRLIASMHREDKLVDVSGDTVDLGAGVRRDAIAAASMLDDLRAIEAIATVALNDEDASVRRAAMAALLKILRDSDEGGKWPDPHADVLGGADTPLAITPAQVARALLLAGGDTIIEGNEPLLLRALGSDNGADVTEVIIGEMLEALADPRPEITERAADLIVSRATGHIDRLIVALSDPARAAPVATILGAMRDNRAVGPVIVALDSPDSAVRRSCAWALGEIADSRGVRALYRATTDPDYGVRQQALAALEKFGPAGVIGGVANALSALGELPPDRRQLLALPGSPNELDRKSLTAESVGFGIEGDRDLAHDESPADPLTVDSFPAGRSMKITAPDGTVIHAEVFGPEQASTIVLVHGLGGAIRFWIEQIRALSGDFRLIAYDLRGHGASGAPSSDDDSLDTLGHDLEAVLAACIAEGSRALVVGHSLGAAVIAAWANLYEVERRVSAAALLHPGIGDVVSANLLLRVTAMPESAETDQLRTSAVNDTLVGYVAFGPRATHEQVSYYERMLFECSPEVRAKWSVAMGEMNLAEALKHLTVPTVVMSGELDTLTPPHYVSTFANALPNLTALIEMPETGHLGPLERSEEVNSRLRELAAYAAVA